MGFIGQPLNAGNLSVDVFTGNGSTTVFALTYSVGSSESLAIYLDGVKQAVSTYTASGTVLTFTTAPPNLVGIEVVFLALSISLPTPGDGTVTAAKIATDAVTTVKIADNAVGLAQLASGTDGELLTWDASGDPAKVAVGTSGQVLTSGGVGVAPTFTTLTGNITTKEVNSTYDLTTASGTQDITGFGFDPSVVHLICILDNTTTWSVGFTDLSLNRCLSGQGTSFRSNQTVATLLITAGNSQLGQASSITDGFRITWSKTGTPSGTIDLFCLGFK